MNTYLSQFLVNIRGLKAGKHDFTFEINKNFFDCFEYSPIKNGNLVADAVIDKQTNTAFVHFNIKGTIQLPCDTCLVPLDLPVDANEKLSVKQAETKPPTTDYDDDDIVIINEDQNEIDLSAYIYEFIILQKQQRIGCEEIEPKPCDEDYINVLKRLAPTTQNTEPAEEPTNPIMWEKLKNLKLK